MYFRLIALLLMLGIGIARQGVRAEPIPGLSTVFIIVMENHDWSTIKGSAFCPYINNTLLPQAAYANAYYNPAGIHPSEPNYLWLVGGTNFGVKDDKLPSINTQRTTNHLAWLLDRAGVPWKAYVEDITGRNIPLTNNGPYVARHVPFLFFENINTNLTYVTNHIRPYGELARDLTSNTVPNFCFITPNLTNDMHNTTAGSPSSRLQGDNWLAKEIPLILKSAAYQRGGLVIITWDEGAGSSSDGPIGLILLSPRVRSAGFNSSVPYDHSDTLRTLQDILGVRPYLGAAANATGLGEFFKFLRVEAAGVDEAGRHFTLRDAVAGRTYRLEFSLDARPSSWTGVTEQIATAATLEFVDSSPESSHQFFRVRELP